MDPSQPIHLPIDGSLDLHAFSPKDLKMLIPDYLEECRRRGIVRVRIIHGKGKGDLRRFVHAILGRLEYVTFFRLAGPDGGTWGATLVDLKPLIDGI
jgi:DNA-nicking Smr family endonuclease